MQSAKVSKYHQLSKIRFSTQSIKISALSTPMLTINLFFFQHFQALRENPAYFVHGRNMFLRCFSLLVWCFFLFCFLCSLSSLFHLAFRMEIELSQQNILQSFTNHRKPSHQNSEIHRKCRTYGYVLIFSCSLYFHFY